VVVAALGTVLAVTVGISFYGVSVYLESFTRGPDAFPLSTVSVATGAFLVVSGVAGVPVAALMDRMDPRWIIGVGAVVAAGALLAFGWARTPAQLLIAYATLGLGFAATGTIPASALVARWFTRRRATALSLTFIGLPIGGAAFTPPIAALVQEMGVQGAAPWLAAAYLVGVVPVSLVFLRPHPSAVGSWPDGDPTPVPAGDDDSTAADALRTGWFWVVSTALMLGMLAQVGVLSHLFSVVTERLDAGTAAGAVSVMATASLVGRAIGSWALGHVPLTATTVVLLGLQAVATVGIAVAPSAPTLLACTAVFGLTIGNMQVLHPLLVAERYGGHGYGRILALSGLGVMVGTAAGPVLVGVVRAGADSYAASLCLAAAVAMTAGLLIAAFVRSPRRPLTAPASPVHGEVLDVDVSVEHRDDGGAPGPHALEERCTASPTSTNCSRPPPAPSSAAPHGGR
jgi:MFS family permease